MARLQGFASNGVLEPLDIIPDMLYEAVGLMF